MTKVNPSNGNETKSDIFQWDIFKSATISFFHQKMLKYFNEFQNRTFSLLWLKWTQIMELKQNQPFFHGKYSNMTPYLLKYFNDFQNRNFLVLWLKRTQTMAMKQNQRFFHGTYSNLKLFFIGLKMLEYFTDFSISLQKWVRSSRVK